MPMLGDAALASGHTTAHRASRGHCRGSLREAAPPRGLLLLEHARATNRTLEHGRATGGTPVLQTPTPGTQRLQQVPSAVPRPSGQCWDRWGSYLADDGRGLPQRPGGEGMGTAGSACRECGTEMPTGDRFCGGCGNRAMPSCGAPASTSGRSCPACGEALDDLDTFCPSCGSAAPLVGAPKASSVPAAPAPIPSAVPAGATIQRDVTVMRAAAAAAEASATPGAATSRSTKGANAVVAVASAVAVVAISVVVLALLAGTPAQDSSEAAAATTAATTTTVAAVTTTAPAPPAPPPTPEPQPPVTGVSTGPGSGSTRRYDEVSSRGQSSHFWSVVIESKRSRSDAEAVAARLGAMGYEAEIDPSSNYASLKPGYYVVHVGTYTDETSAYAAQEQIRPSVASAGFGDAYRRCFGDVPPCRENDPSIGH